MGSHIKYWDGRTLGQIKVNPESSSKKRRSDKVILSPGINHILFKIDGVITEIHNLDWQFEGTPLCYNSRPAQVNPVITNRTIYGFDVQISDTLYGSMEYTIVY